MTRAADAMTMRQARRTVERMIRKEGKEPYLPLRGTGKPPPLAGEFSSELADAYKSNTLCLACLNATDCFYLIAGSGEFYMRQLARLGVPPAEAVLLAGRNKGVSSLGGIRRTPVCLSCAALAGMEEMPVSDTRIGLMSRDGKGGEQPVPVAILGESEAVIQDILAKLSAKDRKRDQARRKQEEYEMELKGAHKDIADFFEKLKKGQIGKIRALGYMTEIAGNGHIKVYHGEPGREMASDGRFVTSVSATPRNAKRTVDNATGVIARWERANLNTEPELPAAGNDNDDDEMTREYRQWSDQKKATLITRYDYADEAGQRLLLEKNRIRHRDITRFREQLAENGTFKLAPVPVPLPDEPAREQMCDTCGKDKTLTRENFAQEKIQGKYSWARKCSDCADRKDEQPVVVITEPAAKPVTPKTVQERFNARMLAQLEDEKPGGGGGPAGGQSLASSEASRMIALMGRKRDISARLAVIGEEKARKVKALEEEMARLTRELDEEKKRLSTERDQVENDLLELVSG